MTNPLSYRIGHVQSPQLPLDRVAALGIRYLEIAAAPGETPEDVLAVLEPHGLSVMTTSAPVSLDMADLAEQFERCCDFAQEVGARGHFVSLHAGEMPLEEAYQRLRLMGDIAEGYGLFMALETHEDLCENGDKARATMAAVQHQAIGWNLDTANVYYYNQDVDVVEEARKAAPYVRSVHAKDTTGGYKDPDFPNVGEGIVDYAGVHEVLQAVHFTGPYTLELEGIAGSAATVELMEANVAACAWRLRDLGIVD